MESDARADFEGSSSAAVNYSEEVRSPVSSDGAAHAGYVSQDQLAAWIEQHLIPKLQLLTERMDGFELDLKAHKQRTDDQHASAMETPGEYVETFNRAQTAHEQAHAAIEARLDEIAKSTEASQQALEQRMDAVLGRLDVLDSRIGVCEEAMVHAEPQQAGGA